LLSLAPWTKVLSHLLECATEALRRGESTKAQHWVIPLFHSAMILLDAPVEESRALFALRFTNWNRKAGLPLNG